MADEKGFSGDETNKNPLYALSRAQGETGNGENDGADLVEHTEKLDLSEKSCDQNNGGNAASHGANGSAGARPNQPSKSGSPSPPSSASPEGSMRRASVRLSQSEDGKDTQALNICPKINCQEKIIICLDVSQEMDKVTFRTRAGDKFPPMKLIKRALSLYMQSKHKIDRRHQFALVLLQDEAVWMRDFTNDPDEIMSYLQDMDGTFPCETFDMGSLYDIVKNHASLPVVDPSSVKVLPPPYIVRTIFIYGRSHCLPVFKSVESRVTLQKSPYFFMDAFYVHEVPSEENQCEAIFDQICELDDKGLSYIFEVSRNPTKLYDCMAQLLGHPLQRPLQKHCQHDLEIIDQHHTLNS